MTRKYREAGALRMVGVVQEQHPDRARLFMQWKQMDWPIGVDAYDLLAVKVVPITLLIDEHGVIRARDPAIETAEDLESEFLSRSYQAPADEADAEPAATPGAPAGSPDERVARFRRAVEQRPDDVYAHFRLGVAYRQRHDSEAREPGDFQRAVAAWARALELDPNHYIARRRIQQYGPRLDKPYPFYDWIEEARAAIRQRGDSPIEIRVEPGGAEIAEPAESFEAAEPTEEPDPEGRIHRDTDLVAVEHTVVPPRARPGEPVRLHLSFRPDPGKKAHWNNEVDPLVLWAEPPRGWKVDHRSVTAPMPAAPATTETRTVELELEPPAEASGPAQVEAYALYYVCEDVDGACLYRRKDLTVTVPVSAPEDE